MSVTTKGRHYNPPETASRADLASAARTTSSTSTPFLIEDAHTLIGALKITAVAGSSPTLDLVLETTNDDPTMPSALWDSSGAFAQKTGTAQVSEVQSLTSTATGGSVKLVTELGPTGVINFNGTTASVQAALDAILGASVVVASGSGPLGSGAITLTWADKGPHQLITVDNTLATGGTAAVSRTTSGSTGVHTRAFSGLGTYGRWKWTIGGSGGPSFTFGVTGKVRRV